MNNETIFVQIASYKDPELKSTINDLLEKAKYPNNIYIGICWQHDDNENLNEYKDDKRFKIIDIIWSESKGACWARSEVQKLYNGENFTLQIDSHHRFIQNWDYELINMLKELKSQGYEKPIITTYGGVYDPLNKQNIFLDNRPFKMITSGFTPEGILLFYPSPIQNYENLIKPIKARFISGHFYFTLGKHCYECKYDPNVYFHGEEISLSVRSYTLGYDLFHPHKLIIWHNYTRSNRIKHWDDHVKDNTQIKIPWYERDSFSKKRIRKLLNEEIDNNTNLEVYGLGILRSLADYEIYSGINFKDKKIEKYTTKGLDPPNP